jgi:hypothetical protein
MAIKNKDGSVYKLVGPNPIIQHQDNWDISQVRLINMRFGSEVIKDKNNPVEKFKSDFNVLNISEKLNLKTNDTYIPTKDFIEEIKQPEIVEQPVEQPTEPIVEQQPVKQPVQLEALFKKDGVKFFCAPAIGTLTHVDSLYGSTYNTTQYGDKFIFEAIVVDQSDLQLQIWSLRDITINSIIHLKVKEGAERWWRINQKLPKTGGYLLTAISSDSCPDFS